MDCVVKDRVICPPLKDIPFLQQPLTTGEMKVLTFLNAHLPEDWEIYIQPHMNGLCPDFVVLHPRIGIVVIEVKDWNLQALNYSWHSKGSNVAPFLTGKKGTQEFIVPSPFDQLELYKHEIFNLYCPSIGIRFDKPPIITSVIVFGTELTESALRFMEPCFIYKGIEKHIQRTYYPIVGMDLLEHGSIAEFAPVFSYRSSKYMSEEYALELRYWLTEPRAKEEQRIPITLNSRQKEFATKRTQSGYRRIRGAAGAGKSLVLASKASNLALEGKKVLVLSYNITLCNYLGDLAVRAAIPKRGIRKSLTLLNYHQWAKRICIKTGNKHLYDQLSWHKNLNYVLEEGLSGLVAQLLPGNPSDELLYDAILVDEGQDFRLSWWASLRHALKPDGEALLVADKTQDLYGTADAWTDEAMLGAGFSGAWAELKQSYRMPEDFIQRVKDFAQRYIKDEKKIAPEPPPRQGELATYQTQLTWIQTTAQNAVSSCVEAVLKMPLKARNGDKLVYPDVVIMAAGNKDGFQIVKALGNKGIRVRHTFGKNEEYTDPEVSRKQKMAFYIGAEQVKATTIHSFKGWESTCLVVHISRATNAADIAAIYTALTRLKASEQGYDSHLTVVCSVPELEEYGRTWA